MLTENKTFLNLRSVKDLSFQSQFLSVGYNMYYTPNSAIVTVIQ
jgi:hypothetical protein